MRKSMMAAVVAAAFGVAGQAAAAVQTFSLHEERTGAVVDYQGFGSYLLGQVPMFDPSLGTLNSITLTSTVAYNLGAHWNEPTGWTGSVGIGIGFNTGFVIADSKNGEVFTLFIPDAFIGDVAYPGDVGSISTGLVTLPTTSVTDSNWPNIFDFIGHKQVKITTTNVPYYVSECTGNGEGCEVPDVRDTFTSFDVSLAYDYTPGLVPEPSTWTLALAGIGMAGAALRRARRQQAA